MERQTALSRRDFLRGGKRDEAVRIWPPGVEDSALSACTGCGACADHCPEPVFAGSPVGRFDHVVTIADACLPFRGVDCQACRDACPAGAIRFRPVRGGPFVPDLAAAACTGCGACISVCPVGAVSAVPISVEPADV